MRSPSSKHPCCLPVPLRMYCVLLTTLLPPPLTPANGHKPRASRGAWTRGRGRSPITLHPPRCFRSRWPWDSPAATNTVNTSVYPKRPCRTSPPLPTGSIPSSQPLNGEHPPGLAAPVLPKEAPSTKSLVLSLNFRTRRSSLPSIWMGPKIFHAEKGIWSIDFSLQPPARKGQGGALRPGLSPPAERKFPRRKKKRKIIVSTSTR